jgi:hypothetical protein
MRQNPKRIKNSKSNKDNNQIRIRTPKRKNNRKKGRVIKV